MPGVISARMPDFFAGVSKAQIRLCFKEKLGQGFAGTGVYFTFEKLNIGAGGLGFGIGFGIGPDPQREITRFCQC